MNVGYDANSIIYLCIGILASLIFAFVSYFLTSRWLNTPPSLSPYTKMPLRNANDLSYENKERVLKYLYNLHQYDNQMFNFEKAALCRETKRVFPNAVSFYGVIEVDWTFLNKRYPGNYVSWGSLTDYQREIIAHSHHSMKGYQTKYSSPNPAPSQVEEFYAYNSPGPLYVDLDTKVLLGWKVIPMTDVEVMIVQKPKGLFEISSH